jgi:DNA-binding GntR family transcriptional regulator
MEPVTDRLLSDAAYERIHEAIITSELCPGAQVSESQLTADFGFGRAAVRAALTRLCHEQLVQAVPRRGYIVAPVTFKHIGDLFGVRLVIEPAATPPAAAHADQPLLAELERLNEQYTPSPSTPAT